MKSDKYRKNLHGDINFSDNDRYIIYVRKNTRVAA